LIGWVRRSDIGPREFEIAMTHPILNDPVDETLNPPEQRRQPFLLGGFLRCLGRGSVDLRGKSRRRQRERV